ncbi:MAG: transposase [Pseudomonadota bacterium]
MITLLSKRIDRLETEIAVHISAHMHVDNRHEMLLSAPGLGNVVAATLLAKLPELGTVNRRAIANLAGLAPHVCDPGHMRGRRKIWGGGAEVRSTLYIAVFIASKSHPEFRSDRKKLEDAGKPFNVAIIAAARRLLVQLNAMIRENRCYEQKA